MPPLSQIHLTEDDVKRLLPMPRAIELMDRAFRELAAGTAINHPRRRVVLPGGSILHYMPAGNQDYFGIKVYSTNVKSGAHFQVLLYRSQDGAPLASVDANYLGQIRTGAASGLATRILAREDARTVGVIGSGFQAETQIAAMLAVRPVKEFRVWSRDAAKRQAFARECAGKFGVAVRATDSAREAVEKADIVVTATSAKDPVLESGWIAPGTHINAMGSNWKHRRELPGDLVNRAGLVTVDSVEQAQMESGDLILADYPPERQVELSDIVAGKHLGRTADSQITIFKSNGLAIEDIVAAGYVYEASSYS